MNLFIVEDSDEMRENLRTHLLDLNNINILGYAADEATAVGKITALQPDAIILDIRLREGTGYSVLKKIKQQYPWIKVMVLTNYGSEFYRQACKQAQVDAFLDKAFDFMRVSEVIQDWADADHRPQNCNNQ